MFILPNGTQEVALEQGSDEWLAWRSGKNTASNAAAVVGCAADYSHIKTWDDLRELQMGRLVVEHSSFTEQMFAKGHEEEDRCRAHLLSGWVPICFELQGTSLAASLDAYNPASGDWSEIKSPYTKKRSKMWRTAEEGGSTRTRIPDHIWWQMVHQALVLQAKDDRVCYLVLWIDYQTYTIIEVPVSMMRDDMNKLRMLWDAFNAGEDYGAADSDTNEYIWDNAIMAWCVINKAITKAEADLEESIGAMRSEREQLETVLKDMAPHVLGDDKQKDEHGVKIVRKNRKGSVSWKNTAAGLWTQYGNDEKDGLKEFSEAYRGKDSVSYVIQPS